MFRSLCRLTMPYFNHYLLFIAIIFIKVGLFFLVDVNWCDDGKFPICRVGKMFLDRTIVEINKMDNIAESFMKGYYKKLGIKANDTSSDLLPYRVAGPVKGTISYEKAIDLQLPKTPDKDKNRAHHLQRLQRDNNVPIEWKHCQRTLGCKKDGECNHPWHMRKAKFTKRIEAINADPDLPWENWYECCTDFMFELLIAYLSALKAGGGENKFFIHHGTLIAALREKDLFFTQDADIEIHPDFHDTIWNNRTITDPLNDRGFVLLNHGIHRVCKAAHVERQSLEICDKKKIDPWHKFGWVPYLDAYRMHVKHRENDKDISDKSAEATYFTDFALEKFPVYWRPYHLFPTSYCQLRDMSVPCPVDPVRFMYGLYPRYGDWSIPREGPDVAKKKGEVFIGGTGMDQIENGRMDSIENFVLKVDGMFVQKDKKLKAAVEQYSLLLDDFKHELQNGTIDKPNWLSRIQKYKRESDVTTVHDISMQYVFSKEISLMKTEGVNNCEKKFRADKIEIINNLESKAEKMFTLKDYQTNSVVRHLLSSIIELRLAMQCSLDKNAKCPVDKVTVLRAIQKYNEGVENFRIYDMRIRDAMSHVIPTESFLLSEKGSAEAFTLFRNETYKFPRIL